MSVVPTEILACPGFRHITCPLFRTPHIAPGSILLLLHLLTIIIFSAMNTFTLYGSYASCTMATFNLIITVSYVVVATFKADVTSCHNWPTKNDFLSQTTSTTPNKHYILIDVCDYVIIKMHTLHTYILSTDVYFGFIAPVMIIEFP